jgi:predicted metal-dependent HD superfamily phosphohydrolase
VAPPEPPVFERLMLAYGERQRSYHTAQHLHECFAKLDELRHEAARPAEVELALWFHDAVYDPRSSDNEAKSAEWAREVANAAGVAGEAVERIASLILATRHEAPPVAPDEKVLVDVDLSILGASPARFDEYERQVREEYAWLPEAEFCARRRKVLEGFLGRASIFSTRSFAAAYEAPARANLKRSLARLGG